MDNAIIEAANSLFRISETQRTERMRKAWMAYYGQSAKPLKVIRGQADDNLRENFARIIVDKSVSFLFGKEIGFELDETGETEAEKWLKEVWARNKKMTLMHYLALNGAVCGQAFLKIHYPPGAEYPRLIVLDPETVTVSLASDDIENVLKFEIAYTSYNPIENKIVGIHQTIQRDGATWIITDEIGDENYDHWSVVEEQIWPYNFPPIVYCQNLPSPNEFWGTSDIEDDLLEANDKLNFTMSNMLKIIRYHGHPKTWGTGFDARQLKIAVDETLVLPQGATLQNLEMQSDLGNSIEVYKRIKEFLHELSRTPEIATGKLDNVGSLSGLALQILYQPIIEKTNTKRLLYGDMLIELNRRLLAIGGYGEDNYTKIIWPDILPADTTQQINEMRFDKEIGASDYTLLSKRGYDPELEADRRKMDTQSAGEALLAAFNEGL